MENDICIALITTYDKSYTQIQSFDRTYIIFFQHLKKISKLNLQMFKNSEQFIEYVKSDNLINSRKCFDFP